MGEDPISDGGRPLGVGTQEETGVLDRFAGMPSSRGPSVSGAGGNGHTALLMSDFAAPDEEPVGWLESEDLKWSKMQNGANEGGAS